MNSRFGLLFALVTGLSFSVGAEVLTLDDCISEALANNPAIEQVKAGYEADLARSRVVEKLRLPFFSTRFSYFRLSDVDPFVVQTPMGTINLAEPVLDNFQAVLTAQQPIFTGFRLSNQVELARKGSHVSRLAVEGSRWDLRFEVIKAYYGLINARSACRVIAESVKAMEAHVQDIRNFKEAGIATTNDVLQTEVMLSNLHIQLNRIENGVEIAEVTLETLLNRQERSTLEIEEDVTITSKNLPSLDRLIEIAQRSRIELRRLEVQREMAGHTVALSRSDYFPMLFASGSCTYARPNIRYQPPEEEFNGDWSVGLVLTYVPFDWGRTEKGVQQSRAEQREIDARYEQVSQQVRARVIQAYLQHKETVKRLDLVRVAVNQATENLRVARDQYKEGMSRNTDVLDAETMLLQANLGWTRAEIDYLLTRLLLIQAVGTTEL